MSNELIELVLEEAAEKMSSAHAYAKSEFSSVRTGRANPAIIERVVVVAYGVENRLQELAGFSVPEARQLLVTPFDPQNLEPIEKAIMNAGLGLTPSNDGRMIRLSFPALTEERRGELVKVVNNMAEDARNKMRGVRRDSRKDLEGLEKEGGISEDDIARAEARLDELTHQKEAEIESAREAKENELREI